MSDIPITFEYEGDHYSGILSSVTGAASQGGVWFLLINQLYCGQLHNTAQGWTFLSQTGKFNEMAEYFGQCVVAWWDANAEKQ